MVGGCVCVPNEFDRMNNITSVINQMKVDVAALTPSFAQLIQPSDVPCLRTLILGGEAMSKSHLSLWAGKVNLVNAYGPSECSVVAAVNAHVTRSTNPANIGRGLDRCWIVDARNHHRLAPIGSVGELLVEGPTLARGYLKNQQKTAEAFIKNPRWSMSGHYQYPGTAPERRMYKTGDLVKVCSDATAEMIFLGRKDTQVKVNGQRLELDEIEHHLSADGAVQHALVVLPKSGCCAKRLVAVLSLQELATSGVTNGLKIVSWDAASLILPKVQERLRNHLPTYMIPSKWVVLRRLPLLPSGKLDRRQLIGFVEDMSAELHAEISVAEDNAKTSLASSDRERQLQLIWGHVLNINPQRVALNQSFLHLGGDSMSAMQVMAKCRSEGMGVTVQDIIRSKSISDLASRVSLPEQITYKGEDAHEFDLSPIQQLYFSCVGSTWAQFNQSVLLRSSRKMSSEDVTRAFNAVMKAHSMLRARFRKDGTGNWKQRITTDVSGSYRFRAHNATTPARMKSRMEDSQRSLDIQKGPMVAVDLFHDGPSDTQLFIAAHHLVIDVVSWRIILEDLEDLINFGTLKSQGSLPFQAWCRLQIENAQQQSAKLVLPHQEVPVADLDYWGMKDKPNVHCDAVSKDIEFDRTTTKLLLGNCHQSLQTDPVDVLLAAILRSFRHAFPAREKPPAVYNEGHGREPWETKLDLSRTVGWFTTLCPVYLPTEASMGKRHYLVPLREQCLLMSPPSDDDFVPAIRWVKDFRRRLPEKGRSYFAYRLLTSEGKDHFGDHWPIEVAFNYLGQMQQLERADALFQSVDGGQSVNSLSDIGEGVPRFALIEISAAVTRGCMKVSFSYNKQMKHQSNIATWVAECQHLLRQAPNYLMQRKAEPTLSDFPLLPLAYHGLGKLVEKLPEIGVSSLEEIEDIFPCSPMQRGILLSQMKDPEKYAYQSVFEVRSAEKGRLLDLDRLERAWQGVVERHATLRTIFVDSVGQEDLVDQIVVRQSEARTARLKCRDPDVQNILADLPPLNSADKQPPHRLAFCQTSTGRIFCRLDMSHVISDGSSMPILLRDLAEAYNGTVAMGKTTPRYSDYIAYLQSMPREEGLDYWKAYLANVEPCLFPALVDGATEPQRILGSYTLKLEQASELHAFCTNSGVTLSNVLQLVWALVVRCYTGSDEVCFGYVASGRDMPVEGIEDAVGVFINMLICRINLEDSLELGEALDKVQMDFVTSMAHQTCSLAEVQHELKLSGTSLFNTAFTYQRRSGMPEQSGSALLYDIVETHDPSEYSIAVNVEATDSSIEIRFSYWTNNMSHAQAKNVASTFEQVLKSLIRSQQGERTVGYLDFFSEHSCMQVCNWNRKSPPKVKKCIHELIEQQALLRPLSTPAVHGWDANFTYTELEAVATRLAKHLVGLGVGPEIYVPLCFEKSAWAIVAQLGVLKAGGAFVPLDPSHPESRLRHLVNDVGAKLVLCSPKHKEKASKLTKMTFIVDQRTINQLSSMPATPPSCGAGPSDPAYVIFTSGTTGLPKGTVIEHASVSTSGIVHGEAMFMRSDSRVLQFSSYTFDACIVEILWTLLAGGCICVPSDEDKMNDLPGAIRKMGVTWTCLTPSVANTLSPKSVPSLRVIVSAGEAMPIGYIAKWADTVVVLNVYGPTETSVVATMSTKSDERGQKINEDPATIGTARGGRAWIVDPHNYNHLVPVGAVGELVVEGTIVARGYLNNDKKTAEAFVNNLEWAKSRGVSSLLNRQDRMYRTGDLVRYNSDGTLCYLSRKDAQIKLNGQRIELGEIEYHCKQNLPNGAQPAVELVMLNRAVAAKALAVFFSLPADEAERSPSETTAMDELLLHMDDRIQAVAKTLEVSLAQALPTYMIPQLFVPVSKMPWLTSGKLDRKRLREMVQALSEGATAPYRLAISGAKSNSSTEMEKKLQRLWEKVLRLAPDSVEVEDNFFRLGGDSLAAMSLVGAARSQNIALTVTNIFKVPKLSDMARTCDGVQEDSVVELEPFSLLQSSESVDQVLEELADQCRIDMGLVQDIYPTSPLQESLIALTVKQAGAYVAQNVFRLSPSVDIGRFKMAWQKTVDDLDMLRTRIVQNASFTFLQVVIKEEHIVWHTRDDLQAVTDDTKHIPAYIGGPLTRYTIINDNVSADRYFVWSIHHALYDGWSLPLVLNRVRSAYLREVPSQPECSYASFIQYLQKADAKASEEFWRSHLAGASSMHFPQSPHIVADQASSTRTLSHRTNISREGISPEITVATIIRAAWTTMVAAYTGSDDVVFGEILTGRDVNLPGVADIVGPTLTTVPTRIRMDHSLTVIQFLRQVHQMSAEIIPYQHLGLQNIRRLHEDAAIACGFQNLLVIQTTEEKNGDSFWELQESGSADNFFTYPLVVECKLADDEAEIITYHNENVISTWRVQRLLYQFGAVLKQLSTASKSSSTKLTEVEVFSHEDEETVERWNHTKPQIVDVCIHDLFKRKALSQPSSQAVCAWDGDLTYQEVYGHASRLALYLVTLGVGPEVLVPICMDKSAWTVVTILGILIAGGAFCPLDPTHPISRHQELLEELKTNMILCSPAYADRYSGLVEKQVAVEKNMILSLPALYRPNQLSHRASSNNTAYIIFTSGSTGRAKGVVIEHRAFCSSSTAFGKAMLMKHNSRVFQFASLTFDAAVMEILTTLTFGGCICVPVEEERLNDTAGVMRRMAVTWTCLTPSVANLIKPSTVPTLEVLACGGEAMPTETVTKWAKHVRLLNAYGPAEASVVALVNAKTSVDGDPACIGKGTAATLTWIVDAADHNRLAPVGAVGELVLDGPALARQYLGNPEKTMEAFIDHPAWASRFMSGTRRIYKTGDLVRYTPNGTLEFAGRKDNQVKLNGQRLELGEIENRLDADSRIRHALVLMPKSGPCKKRLAAVLSLSSLYPENTSLSAATCVLVKEAARLKQARKELTEIQSRLSDLLPSYMIPKTWVVVEDIPMLVSGKLDRKQVTAWIGSLDEKTFEWIRGVDKDAGSTIEVTGTAKTLQDIWARVLNLPIETVKPNKSFLSLGKY
jgi:amino acid adenylation domain-containing protein/non-ribosomal peptide synthase protein (TIGR01720 family)